jgi:hypothetical protein
MNNELDNRMVINGASNGPDWNTPVPRCGRCHGCHARRYLNEDGYCQDCVNKSLEGMLKELRAADEVMDVLDQNACSMGPALSRLFSQQYTAVLDLREKELREWNAEYPGRKIYRCDNAETPYHALREGPCEIYLADTSDEPHYCEVCCERLHARLTS